MLSPAKYLSWQLWEMKIVALTDVADTVTPDILHQTAILSQTLLVPKQNQAVRNTSISQQAVKPKITLIVTQRGSPAGNGYRNTNAPTSFICTSTASCVDQHSYSTVWNVTEQSLFLFTSLGILSHTVLRKHGANRSAKEPLFLSNKEQMASRPLLFAENVWASGPPHCTP